MKLSRITDAILLAAMAVMGLGILGAALFVTTTGCGSRQRITNTVAVHDTVCVHPPRGKK